MDSKKSKSWFLYVLWCADGSLYTGITTDLEKRLLKHNKGKGAKYTRCRLPCTYAGFSFAGNKSTASKLEAKFKQKKRKEKIEFLNLGLENFVNLFYEFDKSEREDPVS